MYKFLLILCNFDHYPFVRVIKFCCVVTNFVSFTSSLGRLRTATRSWVRIGSVDVLRFSHS